MSDRTTRSLPRARTIAALAIIGLATAAASMPTDASARSMEYTCSEAGAALFSDEEQARDSVYTQAEGTTAMLRNLLCFVRDTRCSCLEELLDPDFHRHSEFKTELQRAVGRCNAENPDRNLSGATQEAAFRVCQNRVSCVDPSKIDPDRNCLDIFSPVCGCDHRQYGNACEAESAGVQFWDVGPCTPTCVNPDDVHPDAPCTREYDPVCGCDGRTYGNECEARNSGLASWESGSCGDGCLDPSTVNESAICPAVVDPVCGCNGRNYSNPCEATADGVTFWQEGSCSGGS